MSNKIILHIGLQKTASTYLQRLIFPKLKEIVYIGRPYTQENHAFNKLQYADDSHYSEALFRAEIEKIKASAAGKPILISDELFSGNPNYNFINRGMITQRLQQILPDAEIVLFLREQKDLLLSLYNQAIKTGNFSGHLDEHFLYAPGGGLSVEKWRSNKSDWNARNRFINHLKMYNIEHFRYSRLYDFYAAHFSKVHVFLYEDLQENPKTCLQKLFDMLSPNVDFDWTKRKKGRSNKRLTEQELNNRLSKNFLTDIALSPQYFKKIAGYLFKQRPIDKEKNQEYVASVLQNAQIYKDNLQLNQKLQLGMEKHADKYFNAINPKTARP